MTELQAREHAKALVKLACSINHFSATLEQVAHMFAETSTLCEAFKLALAKGAKKNSVKKG